MALKDELMFVFCRTRFIAFHYWPEAPEKFAYLSRPHRHEFHVEVCVNVLHNERDVEFIWLRKEVDSFLDQFRTTSQHNAVAYSCETFCDLIAWYLDGLGVPVLGVSVSEDGENGATKFYE